jgi:hypothetical protein
VSAFASQMHSMNGLAVDLQISPNHEYGESTEMLSTGQERAVMECNMADPTCMRPSANLSITDAVCNSMKSELERLNRSAFPTAISLEDAEREEMLQTILDDTTVSDCTLATISIADTSCEAIRQYALIADIILCSVNGLSASALLLLCGQPPVNMSGLAYYNGQHARRLFTSPCICMPFSSSSS